MNERNTLLPIQVQLLLYLDAQISRGICPTQREMAEFLGLQTGPGALWHLKALERFGYIRRGARGAQRMVQILPGPLPEAPLVPGTPKRLLNPRAERKPDAERVRVLAARLKTVYEQPGRTWEDVARAALGFRVERIAA